MENSTTISIYALCYCMMFILTWICKRNKSNRLFDTKGLLANNAGNLIGLHLAGIGWFGLVPLTLFYKYFKIGLAFNGFPALSWTFLFVLLFVFAGLTGFRTGRQIPFGQSNILGVSKKLFVNYFGVRVLFLCSYELFFRGYLLFDCMQWWGVYPAILITTGLTVLIHVFTNKREMLACIPFGILLSSCCIAFNSVWPAIVLHLALSLTYEVPFSLKILNQLKPIK